jgi:hypothetical protein
MKNTLQTKITSCISLPCFYSKISNFLSRDAGIPALVNLKVSPTSSLKKWVVLPSLNFEFDVTILMLQEI